MQRITVNGAVSCTLETSSTNNSLLIIKKNQQGKRREKIKQGKLQSPQRITKSFFTSQKITISKVVLYISKNYNLQSRSSHRPTPSQGKNHKKGKEKKMTKGKRKRRRKRKRKKRRKRKRRRRRKRKWGIGRKEGRTGIMEKAGLKSFPRKHTAPSENVPQSSSINGQG